MQHYFQNIFGYFTYPDFYKYINYNYNNSVIVELGSFTGQSAAFMGVEILNSNKNNKLICVDTFEGSIEHQELDMIKNKELFEVFNNNIKPVKQVVSYIKGFTYDVVDMFPDNSLDVVFVDADHSYEAVKQDISLWWPKLRIGGIMSGHDYQWEGVYKATHELFGGSIIEQFKYQLVWCVFKV